LSRDILRRKPVAGEAIGGGRWIGGCSFEKSDHLFVESPGKMTFPAFAGTSFEHNSDKPLRHAFFDEALCLNIGIPRVFGVASPIRSRTGHLRHDDGSGAPHLGRRLARDGPRRAGGGRPLLRPAKGLRPEDPSWLRIGKGRFRRSRLLISWGPKKHSACRCLAPFVSGRNKWP
jgi:hypothetical protein